MWSDIALITIFIFLNGFFAAAEIAVVTIRKSRIKQLIEEGNKTAEILKKFKENPDKFLATIQIAITFVGVLAAALGGAAAIEIIKPAIKQVPVPLISVSSEAIAIGIVTISITYFTLIFGELVPKSLALNNPDWIGLRTAPIVDAFSKITVILVKVLTASTNVLLKPFGGKRYSDRAFISEEEVKMLIIEGGEQGVFEPAEQELIHSVFEFTDMSAKEVMSPATQMVTIGINMPINEIQQIIGEEQFSRYPVIGKDINEVLENIAKGIVEKDNRIRMKIAEEKIKVPQRTEPETEDILLDLPDRESLIVEEFKKRGLDPKMVNWSDSDWDEYQIEHDLRDRHIIQLQAKRDEALKNAESRYISESVDYVNAQRINSATQNIREIAVSTDIDPDEYGKIYRCFE